MSAADQFQSVALRQLYDGVSEVTRKRVAKLKRDLEAAFDRFDKERDDAAKRD